MKSTIKAHMRAGDHEAALSAILRVTPQAPLGDIEYASIALGKIPEKVLAARCSLRKKLALLGGATTQFVAPMLRLFAMRRGVHLDVYESGFGLFEQEILTDSSELHTFGPDAILFYVCRENLSFGYEAVDPAGLLSREMQRFLQLYRLAAERFSCPVLADNFTTDVERPYGALDATLQATRNSLVRACNLAIVLHLPPRVHIHDVEALSAKHGKLRWHEPRLYHSAKCTVSFECLPYYADSVAASVAALFGKSKKCLVLDLDNTLWGGVIGDDGMAGIQIGAGEPAGEAFAAFQRYVKALKERGVLLAVASKNEEANARQPFREHPDMTLKESDISCFVANWEPKDGSLRTIAKRLNIGIDSLVFFDDNPAERELVRTQLPEVAVPEVPADPSTYVRCLDDANWFEALTVTDEDRVRSDFFQGNLVREQLEESAVNYEDYLQQLQMKGVVEPITPANLTRATQLINKTNQFNLTTQRMTEGEVLTYCSAPRCYTSAIRVIDKFGDNGLISVVMASPSVDDATRLIVDVWLMSCRVLKRGVEILAMEQLLAFCRSSGIKSLVGRYRPTAKNKLVSRHYEALGFTPLPDDAPWSLWIYDIEMPLALRHYLTIKP